MNKWVELGTPWACYHVTLMAITAWREARSESEEGIRAVLHVIRNRVTRGGWFGKRWDEVIARKWQFTSMTGTGDSQLVAWPQWPDDRFEICMEQALAIYHGRDLDPTNGATHYWNPKTATSVTFKNAVANGKLVETAKIGNHIFYREVA